MGQTAATGRPWPATARVKPERLAMACLTGRHGQHAPNGRPWPGNGWRFHRPDTQSIRAQSAFVLDAALLDAVPVCVPVLNAPLVLFRALVVPLWGPSVLSWPLFGALLGFSWTSRLLWAGSS